MKRLYAESLPNVYLPIAGCYLEGGKVYLVEEEIEYALGESIRFDLVIARLAESLDLPTFLFERVKTRVDG